MDVVHTSDAPEQLVTCATMFGFTILRPKERRTMQVIDGFQRSTCSRTTRRRKWITFLLTASLGFAPCQAKRNFSNQAGNFTRNLTSYLGELSAAPHV